MILATVGKLGALADFSNYKFAAVMASVVKLDMSMLPIMKP